MKGRHPLVTLLLRWMINALGIMVAAFLIPGIDYQDNRSLVIVVVLLGLFNAFLKPILVFFTLPFVVLTLGVGVLVINALLFLLAAHLVDGFEVSGFFAAFFGALIVSVFNLVLGRMVGDPAMPRRTPPGGPPRRGGGRNRDDDVIDV
jgi:putative membrane protein